MDILNGKVALITGGAMGLGKATATVLLQRGCKVSILDIDEKHGNESVAEFKTTFGNDKCVFLKCNVEDDKEFEEGFVKTLSLLGGLDIVVNNAGILGLSNWRKTFSINTEAVFHGTLLGMKYMGTDNGGRGGHVINVASEAGIKPWDAVPAYSASKFAVVAMTRAFGVSMHHAL